MEEEQKIEDEKKEQVGSNKSSYLMLVGGLILAVALVGGAILASRRGSKTPETLPAQTEVSTNSTQNRIVTSTPTPRPTSQPVEGTSTDSKVVTIEMQAGSFYFNPKEIRVKKGQTVKINLKAMDAMHNFNIDELGVKSPTLNAGETTTIDFVANKLGEFEYYCLIGQHRKLGQVGTLIDE